MCVCLCCGYVLCICKYACVGVCVCVCDRVCSFVRAVVGLGEHVLRVGICVWVRVCVRRTEGCNVSAFTMCM